MPFADEIDMTNCVLGPLWPTFLNFDVIQVVAIPESMNGCSILPVQFRASGSLAASGAAKFAIGTKGK
jgi:hypothetical protein